MIRSHPNGVGGRGHGGGGANGNPERGPAFAPAGPWVGNALPFLMAAAASLMPDHPPLGVQVLPLAVLTVTFRPDLTLFPFRRLPTVLVGSSVDLHAIADFARAAG